jgi:hypothetical protein
MAKGFGRAETVGLVVGDDTAGRLASGRHDLVQRARDMSNIAAISACEGMYPSPEYATIRERYTRGEITIEEFQKQIEARWERNA